MSRKSKGINAERELVHKFWATNKWSAVRIAGSGSMRYPSADVLATDKLRKLAIECKSSKDKTKYLTKDDLCQLKQFSEIFNAEPWIGIKFNNEEWYFLSVDDIKTEKKCYSISLDLAKKKGLLFDELIGM